VLRIRQVPGGEVLNVRILRSSGDPGFDQSAESAVLKASPLPVPSDPRLFNAEFRELDLEFSPRG
jgi:TonB family protein